MQLATAEREVTGSEVLDSAEYGISPRQVAHIMGILRSSLYTRKALAVLREYGTNAWDAHREIGIFDLPIQITLPTQMRPTFICRDFGPGMSQKTVLRVYTQYGESTKRGSDPDCPECASVTEAMSATCESNEKHFCDLCILINEAADDQAGALGIGSKSAFCLSDTFTITSWHDGVKSRYSAVLDRSNKGRMELLDRQDCDEDETGIEIKVAVKPTMVYEFEREARQLFRYMDPQPKINIVLASLPSGLKTGWLDEKDGDWVGLMGPVPYRIDIDQIQTELTVAGVTEAIESLSGGIHIPLGAVEFSANREELQYTDVTIKVLVHSFKALFEEYVQTCLKALTDETLSGWERRSKATFLANSLKFPLPGKLKFLAHRAADLWAKEALGAAPKTFTLLNKSKQETHRIPVALQARVLMYDDLQKRKMAGWRLQDGDVVVVPKDGFTATQARIELLNMLPEAMLDGVPIESIVIRAWHAPITKASRPGYNNPKHRVNCFRLVATSGKPYSENWETVTRVPEDTDIFVVIAGFEAVRGGVSGFFTKVRHDKALAKRLGVPFPEIYGYKTTQRKKVKTEDCKGTTYHAWRVPFFAKLVTGKMKADMRTVAWSHLFQSLPYKFGHNHGEGLALNFKRQLPEVIEKLTAALGAKHSVVRYFVKYRKARKDIASMKRGRMDSVKELQAIVGTRCRPAPELALDRMLKTYPMLGLKVDTDNQMTVFMTHTDLLTAYILRTDRENT